jgi:hypothetical protein
MLAPTGPTITTGPPIKGGRAVKADVLSPPRGGYKMKKLLLGSVFLTLVFVFPVPTMAGVNVGINIGLPPPIVFAKPPEMIVIPETYVYAVPDVPAEIYFYNGWWWRPWEGRWYRSRRYDSGWVYYKRVPSFYGRIPPGWRNDYRDHRWGGRPWNYQRIPHRQLQRNWSTWQKNRHWEKQQTWGVQGLKPRTQSQRPSRAIEPKSQARPPSREVEQQRTQPQHRPERREEEKPERR